MLRMAGAKEIHFRVASPMIQYPCFYGIDTPTKEELINAVKTKDEVIGSSLFDYIKDEDKQMVTQYFRLEKSGPYELDILQANGEYRTFLNTSMILSSLPLYK